MTMAQWDNTDGGQSLAALGQCKLMSLWTQVFQELRQPIAQVLVSKEDIYEVSEFYSRICEGTRISNLQCRSRGM